MAHVVRWINKVCSYWIWLFCG